MSIKKIVTSNKSEETELDNAYQRALITRTENNSNLITRKWVLHKWKNGPFWVIMSSTSLPMDLKLSITWM